MMRPDIAAQGKAEQSPTTGQAYLVTQKSEIRLPQLAYRGISVADLEKIKEEVAALPERSALWQNLACAFATASFGAVVAALTTSVSALLPRTGFFLAAFFLAAMTLLCIVFHRAIGTSSKKRRDEICTDIDRAVFGLEEKKPHQ